MRENKITFFFNLVCFYLFLLQVNTVTQKMLAGDFSIYIFPLILLIFSCHNSQVKNVKSNILLYI